MNCRTLVKRMIPAGIVVFLTLMTTGWAAEFSVRAGGGISVGGQDFTDMREYVQSDYFRENGMRCGARIRGDRDEALARSTAHCTNSLTSIQNEYFPGPSFSIPVWWHVIYRTSGQGNISDAAIEAQMEVLNEDFRAKVGTKGSDGYDVKIEFELMGITRTKNNGWFTDSDSDELAYKNALAKDPDRYINIYTNDARGYLGYAYLPQGSAGAWYDGIVLYYESVGGRNNGFSPYDQGRTLVHEMGHYLGLLHTFEGGCTNSYSSGDLIRDTNAESGPNYYACSTASSCGNSDPIHNYMDYSQDICMYEFTREQANRSVCSLVNYRPGLYRAKGVIPPFLSPLILSK